MPRHNVYIGVDNGLSGAIGILFAGSGQATRPENEHHPMVTRSATIAGKDGRRLHYKAVRDTFNRFSDAGAIIILEYPFRGQNSRAVGYGMAAWECVMIAAEVAAIPVHHVAAKTWQKELFGGIKGTAELKKASRVYGETLWPWLKPNKGAHGGDFDAMMLALYGFNHDL